MQEQALFSIPEAARYVGWSRSSTYRALNGELQGVPRLPSVKIAGRRLIERAALDEWIAAVKRQQAA